MVEQKSNYTDHSFPRERKDLFRTSYQIRISGNTIWRTVCSACKSPVWDDQRRYITVTVTSVGGIQSIEAHTSQIMRPPTVWHPFHTWMASVIGKHMFVLMYNYEHWVPLLPLSWWKWLRGVYDWVCVIERQRERGGESVMEKEHQHPADCTQSLS